MVSEERFKEYREARENAESRGNQLAVQRLDDEIRAEIQQGQDTSRQVAAPVIERGMTGGIGRS